MDRRRDNRVLQGVEGGGGGGPWLGVGVGLLAKDSKVWAFEEALFLTLLDNLLPENAAMALSISY